MIGLRSGDNAKTGLSMTGTRKGTDVKRNAPKRTKAVSQHPSLKKTKKLPSKTINEKFSLTMYKIKRIAGVKWLGTNESNRKLFYKIRWLNCDAASDTWQLASQLTEDIGTLGIDELLEEFHNAGPARSCDLHMLARVAGVL